MYGDNKDCPIRITAIIADNRNSVENLSNALIEKFGWKHHSWSEPVNSSVSIYYSRILFHLNNKNNG
jgi:hypothetical protein